MNLKNLTQKKQSSILIEKIPIRALGRIYYRIDALWSDESPTNILADYLS